MSPQFFSLPVLSLIVAVLAVFFGPLIQLFIAKAHIRASVLSANRQRWIDQLREQVAELITLACDLKARAEFPALDGPTTLQKTFEMQLRRSTIELLLNPKEKDHQQLAKLIGEATAGITKPPDEDKTNIRAIVALSQAILKREWERVKETR